MGVLVPSRRELRALTFGNAKATLDCLSHLDRTARTRETSAVRENDPPLRGARRPGEGVKETAAMGWRLGRGGTDHDLRRPGGLRHRAGALVAAVRITICAGREAYATGLALGCGGTDHDLRRPGGRRHRAGALVAAVRITICAGQEAYATGLALGCGGTDHDLRRPGGVRHFAGQGGYSTELE